MKRRVDTIISALSGLTRDDRYDGMCSIILPGNAWVQLLADHIVSTRNGWSNHPSPAEAS